MSTFNRFASELSLERFKQRYDAGLIGAYHGDVGPGNHHDRLKAARRTAAGMRGHVSIREPESSEHVNHAWPTASELLEVAERLEAYVRKLDGTDSPAGLPDVRFGHSYSQQSRASDAATQSALQMPLTRLRERVAKQRLLVAKWERRLADAPASGPQAYKARKRVRETTAKLQAAERILAERETPGYKGGT